MNNLVKIETSDTVLHHNACVFYDAPFLGNIFTGQKHKLVPRVAQFLKLLIESYPKHITKEQILSIADPEYKWASPYNLGETVRTTRASFEALGFKKSILTLHSVGYRLLIPVQVVGVEATLIIPSDDVPLFKYILSTHPDLETTRRLAEKLGLNL